MPQKAISKIIYVPPESSGGSSEVWMDVTDKTVAANNLLSGETALKNDGTNVVGTYVPLSINPNPQVVSPSTSTQNITPDSNYDGMSQVTVNAMQLEEKTVTPSTSTQVITPGANYDGMSQVTVNAIPPIQYTATLNTQGYGGNDVYVEYKGVRYTSNTTFNFTPGETLYCYTHYHSLSEEYIGYIIIDDDTKVSGRGAIEYYYTLPSDNINIQYSYNQVKINRESPDLGEKMIIRTSKFTSYSNSTLTKIGDYAFAGLSYLSAVYMPACRMIGKMAFHSTRIYSLDFPVCSSVGNNLFAFDGLSSTNSYISFISLPLLESMGTLAFYGCVNLPSIDFSLITSIPSSAFQSCTKLATVNIPNASYIGQYAFAYCKSLSTVNFSQCSVIANNAFNSCTALVSAYFSSCTDIYTSAFYYATSLQNISFPECINIGSNAFANCGMLSAVNFPKVVSLGFLAFCANSSLFSVSFPECTSIGNSAFSNCTSLSNIYFPKCTSIGTLAFGYCTSLPNASFPECTSIGQAAFTNCSALSTIYFPKAITIGASAFNSCAALEIASFPECTSVLGNAFANCVNLSAVYLPKCNYISASAFYRCYNLLSLYLLGSSVATLYGTNVFSSTPISNYTTSTGGVYGSIYVPSSLYDAYISATNWKSYSARFVSV